jgi:hypothetical protein
MLAGLKLGVSLKHIDLCEFKNTLHRMIIPVPVQVTEEFRVAKTYQRETLQSLPQAQPAWMDLQQP